MFNHKTCTLNSSVKLQMGTSVQCSFAFSFGSPSSIFPKVQTGWCSSVVWRVEDRPPLTFLVARCRKTQRFFCWTKVAVCTAYILLVLAYSRLERNWSCLLYFKTLKHVNKQQQFIYILYIYIYIVYIYIVYIYIYCIYIYIYCIYILE